MIRKCVCGRTIDIDSQLCAVHKREFGTDSSKWPDWLQEWMKNYNKELNQEKNHFEYAYDDNKNYNTVPGCYKTKALIDDPEGDNDDLEPLDDLLDSEFDEWGNVVENVEGFGYVDIDNQINAERAFNRKLEAVSKGYLRPRVPKGEDVEMLRRARLETHLYEDRGKY